MKNVTFARFALLALFILATSNAAYAKDGPSPCFGPGVLTVNGSATTYLVDPTNLNIMGSNVQQGGHLEFSYSYQLKQEDHYDSPGSFLVKSYDAGGNLIDTLDFPATELIIQAFDEDFQNQVIDRHGAFIKGQANDGYNFVIGTSFFDFDHNALPNDPLVYLNDLSLWDDPEFGMSVFPEGGFIGDIAALANVTSINAIATQGQEIDCPGIPGLTSLVNTLPDNAFHAIGHRTALLSHLDSIQEQILAGDIAVAIQKLRNLRPRVDGCGNTADNDDWIVDCVEQTHFRTLIDSLIADLGG